MHWHAEPAFFKQLFWPRVQNSGSKNEVCVKRTKNMMNRKCPALQMSCAVHKTVQNCAVHKTGVAVDDFSENWLQLDTSWQRLTNTQSLTFAKKMQLCHNWWQCGTGRTIVNVLPMHFQTKIQTKQWHLLNWQTHLQGILPRPLTVLHFTFHIFFFNILHLIFYILYFSF